MKFNIMNNITYVNINYVNYPVQRQIVRSFN